MLFQIAHEAHVLGRIYNRLGEKEPPSFVCGQLKRLIDGKIKEFKNLQPVIKTKCGCKHEDRFDCEYMDENKNCAINKKG